MNREQIGALDVVAVDHNAGCPLLIVWPPGRPLADHQAGRNRWASVGVGHPADCCGGLVVSWHPFHYSSPSGWCTGVPYWGEKICQTKSEGIRLGPVAVPFREIKKPVKAAPLVPIAGHVVNPTAPPRLCGRRGQKLAGSSRKFQRS